MNKEDMKRAAKQEPVASQVLRRRWAWINHTLRRQHHQADSDCETTGKETQGKTQEHMVHRHRGRTAEMGSLLKGQGDDSPESRVLTMLPPTPPPPLGQKASV